MASHPEAMETENETVAEAVTLQINSRCFMKHEADWCIEVKARIKVGTEDKAGLIKAFVIQRPQLRECHSSFHYFMDIPTREICDVGKEVWDRHGNLRERHYGIFGKETDRGNILYVLDVHLEEPFQNKGCAHTALKKLMAHLNTPQPARPGRLPANARLSTEMMVREMELDGEWRRKQQKTCTNWYFAVMHPDPCEREWHSAGFRRIGHSTDPVYLGCCANRRHKCWKPTLPPDEIPKMPSAASLRLKGINRDLQEAVQGGTFQEVFNEDRWQTSQAPANLGLVEQLLHMGASIKDSWALPYAVSKAQLPCIELLLRRSADVNGPDAFGSTPLQLAAALHLVGGEDMLPVAKLLLSRGADVALRNPSGNTALEVLLLKMDSLRDMSDALLGGWKGHQPSCLALASFLQQAEAQAAMTRGAPVSSMRVPGRLGCTCGQCFGDFCSPRTFFQIHVSADLQFDGARMNMESAQWTKGGVLVPDEDDIDVIDDTFMFIPPQFRKKVTRPFAKGFLAVLETIAEVMEKKRLPTRAEVLRQIGDAATPKARQAAAKSYFSKGGMVEFALDAIIEHARECSVAAGCGSIAEGGAFDEDLEALPTCGNDDDYQLVKRQLCAEHMVYGPYYDRQRNDDSSSDDDGEEEEEDDDDC